VENDNDGNYEENDDDITGKEASISGGWQERRSQAIYTHLCNFGEIRTEIGRKCFKYQYQK
jgi:hypothetical protein